MIVYKFTGCSDNIHANEFNDILKCVLSTIYIIKMIHLATVLYIKIFCNKIGEDICNNKYYESKYSKTHDGFKRRFVLYANTKRVLPDPTTIDNTWFNWLHYRSILPPYALTLMAKISNISDISNIVKSQNYYYWERINQPNLSGLQQRQYGYCRGDVDIVVVSSNKRTSVDYSDNYDDNTIIHTASSKFVENYISDHAENDDAYKFITSDGYYYTWKPDAEKIMLRQSKTNDVK